MWTLIRIFPIFCGSKLKNNLYYLNFIKLIEIFRILNGDVYNEDIINEVEFKINDFLTELKQLYKDKSITPKFHFLVHYPRCIKLFGPPRNYSCMRFDSKHQVFKRCIEALNNRINLLKSCAERHEAMQLYHLLCPNYFIDLITGVTHNIDSIIKDFVYININESNIQFFKRLKYNGIDYKINDYVVKENNSPRL
jgi:hypothetical protein